MGAVAHWRLAMAIPALLALPTIIGIYHLRESPVWLSRRGRVTEASRAAHFYRLPGQGDAIVEDVIVEDTVSSHINEQDGPLERFKAVLSKFSKQDSDLWQNFAFLVVLFLLLGWCGFSILSFYAVEVFEVLGSPLPASHTSWVTSLTKVLCALTSFYFLHRFTR